MGLGQGALGQGRRNPPHKLSQAASSNSGSEDFPEQPGQQKVLMLLDNQTAVAYVTTWAEQSPAMRQGWPDNCEFGSSRDTFC